METIEQPVAQELQTCSIWVERYRSDSERHMKSPVGIEVLGPFADTNRTIRNAVERHAADNGHPMLIPLGTQDSLFHNAAAYAENSGSDPSVLRYFVYGPSYPRMQ